MTHQGLDDLDTSCWKLRKATDVLPVIEKLKILDFQSCVMEYFFVLMLDSSIRILMGLSFSL